MAKYVYTLNTPISIPLPVKSGKRRTSLLALAKLFKKIAGGHIPGSVTLNARQTATAASATVTCASVVSGNTVTLNGTALTAAQRHATGTITCAGVDADDTVTVQGVTLTAKQHYAKGTITCSAADADDNVVVGETTFVGTTGAVVLGDATYSVDTGNTEAATSLAAQINGHAVASTVVTATSSGGVVTLRAIASGTAGNSIVLTSTDGTDLAVSGAGTLTGGTAVGASQFDMSGTNAQTATSLGAALTANATVAALMTNTVSSNVVTLRSILTGTAGNAYTLVSSDGTDLAVSGAGTLTNGAAESNNTFDYTGTNAQTAVKIAAAINASTSDIIEHIVSAEASGDTVIISAKVPGYSGNACTIATSGATLTITGSVSRLAGGTETLVTI
jgi:hypothetical protein